MLPLVHDGLKTTSPLCLGPFFAPSLRRSLCGGRLLSDWQLDTTVTFSLARVELQSKP